MNRILIIIQVVLINLAISCDNVGIVALATKGLPEEQAILARRIEAFISLFLKLLLVSVIGFLFELPWLHIRIIGGLLLLYVSFTMLQQSEIENVCNLNCKKNKSFLSVIVSIIAADFSISLDNIIAIVSIVGENSSSLGLHEMLLILCGLLVCVPILLLFSSTISKLMEKYPLLTYICAGYLLYSSIKMIFEDIIFISFFKQVNFTLATPVAILFGMIVVIFGLIKNHLNYRIK